MFINLSIFNMKKILLSDTIKISCSNRLEINSMFIAATLAIIGYSINDTIVLFDRIRENLGDYHKKLTSEKLDEITNRSIQKTFTRTIYTSLTTLIPIFVLLLFGSSGIFTFNMVMLFGIISGTYSSIFIATVIFLEIEKKSIDKKHKPKKIYTDDYEELAVKGVNC